MRASYALPGIFDPVKIGGRWLMDGALVNPIPITAARALGARHRHRVNLNGECPPRGTVVQSHGTDRGGRAAPIERRVAGEPSGGASSPSRRRAGRQAARPIRARHRDGDDRCVQHHAGPDRPLAPRGRSARRDDRAETGRIGLFEFHRAAECIDSAGRPERALPDILEVILYANQAGPTEAAIRPWRCNSAGPVSASISARRC